MRKTYRYRIYPTPKQAARLAAWEDALRLLWNLAHEQRLMGLAHPRGFRRYFSAFDQISNPCEPHPKTWHLDGHVLKFPKLGPMRLVLHRPLIGSPKTCTLICEVDQWFACISTRVEIDDPIPRIAPVVGIDRGCVNLLADSNGRIVENPRHRQRAESRLARANRVVSRRQKGSKNQSKAALRVAKIHRKIRRQREHVLHVESRRYAESQGVIVVERLQIENMSASGGVAKRDLNRTILSAGWSRFVELARYKVVERGGQLIEVPAQYTSQECSVCGVIDAASRISQSRFRCISCGFSAHADVNAAHNILSRRTDGGAACGGSAEVGRPSKQESHAAKRGSRHLGLGSSKAPAFRPG